MRELKSESQIQPDQGEPGVKSSESKENSSDLDRAEADSSALADLTTPVQEAAPARKRRATTPKTVAKTKQQTSLKAKQATPNQVKSIWEPTQPSIVARFQILEQELRQLKTQADQINQQSIEIQSEMQELRTIAHTAHPQAPAVTKQTPSPPASGQSAELNIPPFLRDRRASKTEPVAAATPSNDSTVIASADQLVAMQPKIASTNSSETPPRFSTSPRPQMAVPRRRTLRYYWKRLQPRLQLPQRPGVIALDAVIWTLTATGLRIGLTLLTKSLPFLNLPIFLLLFCPAVLAGYLAFCVPKSSPVLIYRLLLLTLGLLIGGKL
ncbi:hypothetical protein C7B65_17645 [Phormidesmis priestleyi ULC007]|uniref:Uncharacterized protein n=1 Tax=Phormidesmis priestleyi ULC007 TaxID=1920490 RepID=A0A2T1DBA6_9CYAN|nr:hypothetical protein [Phormidesmis priestleyi]PSB17733.1 hypothetical protein C7B65_17645 [Phormidesmis priestleyi ULC007]PZO48674.1 MAG: hypothetical protein DCF14_16185 [Phormidesmis priestleyi]